MLETHHYIYICQCYRFSHVAEPFVNISQQDKCDPLTYHFYIVKLGYKGIYIFFFCLIFCSKHRLVGTC